MLARQNGINEDKRQKALYDVKVHGAPYQVGDLVWLHIPAVPQGQCRKLHHRPFKVMIENATYKIKSKNGKVMSGAL